MDICNATELVCFVIFPSDERSTGCAPTSAPNSMFMLLPTTSGWIMVWLAWVWERLCLLWRAAALSHLILLWEINQFATTVWPSPIQYRWSWTSRLYGWIWCEEYIDNLQRNHFLAPLSPQRHPEKLSFSQIGSGTRAIHTCSEPYWAVANKLIHHLLPRVLAWDSRRVIGNVPTSRCLYWNFWTWREFFGATG